MPFPPRVSNVHVCFYGDPLWQLLFSAFEQLLTADSTVDVTDGLYRKNP